MCPGQGIAFANGGYRVHLHYSVDLGINIYQYLLGYARKSMYLLGISLGETS